MRGYLWSPDQLSLVIIISSETTGPIDSKLCRMIFVRFSTKSNDFILIKKNIASMAMLGSNWQKLKNFLLKPGIFVAIYLNTLFWFRVNQSLFLLISAAWLAEKQQILISVFCMTRLGLIPQSTTFEASTVTNTQLMQLIQLKLFKIHCTKPNSRFSEGVFFIFFCHLKIYLTGQNQINL